MKFTEYKYHVIVTCHVVTNYFFFF